MNTEQRIEEIKAKLDTLVGKPFVLLLIDERPDFENPGDTYLAADIVSTVSEELTKQTIINFANELNQ